MKEEVSLFSAFSIGVGGMVGGGIFSIIGLMAVLAGGALGPAFIISGIVALLTCYSYVKLSIYMPADGGTVSFINAAFGKTYIAGSLNILLFISYIILLALYAFAFGNYAASFIEPPLREIWMHIFTTGVLLLFLIINLVNPRAVLKSEDAINVFKIIALLAFIIGGIWSGLNWERVGPSDWTPGLEIFAGAMLIFCNYEGFELIANASKDVKNPKKSLPVAYYGSVIFVILLYVFIGIVCIGRLSVPMLERDGAHALSAVAHTFWGHFGFILIAIAAMLATASAINATLYGVAKMTYEVAKTGEIPKNFGRTFRGIPVDGMIVLAVGAGFVANFADITMISTMGSAGFLIVFFFVNLSCFKLHSQLEASRYVCGIAMLGTLTALIALFVFVESKPATAGQIWIFAIMLMLAFGGEALYSPIRRRRNQPRV